MEPLENDELTEVELDRILSEWAVPPAPVRLRASIFPESRGPWWRRLWHMSIAVPVPVACCLAILLVATVWQWRRPAPPARPPMQVATQGLNFDEWKPVAELRPRIIRSGDAKN